MTSAIEVGRTRMSVEEQMERIRRHQQGALRERRREDGSLSRSLSFTKDNQYYTLQVPTSAFHSHFDSVVLYRLAYLQNLLRYTGDTEDDTEHFVSG